MNNDFILKIHEKHKQYEQYPATSEVCNWTTKVLLLLFPEQAKKQLKSQEDIKLKLDALESSLFMILESMEDRLDENPKVLAKAFFEELPAIHDLLTTDIQAILDGDPAAKTEYEVIRAYPGFYAISFYRIAHALCKLGVPLIPRIITEFAHSKTGVDIHPGATIAPYFFIDHGTGIVIGETTNIGKNVKIYQGVTLGALSVAKSMAKTKRHPTIEDDVVIYSNATILGGETVIGKGSIIGGNVWITKSIAPNSRAYHQAQINLKSPEESM